MKKKISLSVELSCINLRNPVILASGTCGFGEEIANFVDLKRIGALVTKTITLEPREGNPPPRIAEVEGGIINSIGLQNPGIEAFVKDKLPVLRMLEVPFFVSIAGNTKEEFAELASILDQERGISALELNLSCPNIHPVRNNPESFQDISDKHPGVKGGGSLFAQDPKTAYQTIRKVKAATSLPVIAKLTPQVTDVASIAQVCEEAGADILSLINTIPALAVDTESRKPFLGGITGGLSGPAVRPIALKMVWEVSRAVSVPIIGMGGIMGGSHAIEFILAGATAVGVGTANLVSPDVCIKIVEEIEEYLVENNISRVRELIGQLHCPGE